MWRPAFGRCATKPSIPGANRSARRGICSSAISKPFEWAGGGKWIGVVGCAGLGRRVELRGACSKRLDSCKGDDAPAAHIQKLFKDLVDRLGQRWFLAGVLTRSGFQSRAHEPRKLWPHSEGRERATGVCAFGHLVVYAQQDALNQKRRTGCVICEPDRYLPIASELRKCAHDAQRVDLRLVVA